MILAAWYHIILAVVFAGMATFLMLIILLQRGKGVGLAGAFGGSGGQTVFGSKTGDILTWATVVVAGVFIFFTILLNYVFVPQRAGLEPAAITAPLGAGAPPQGSEPIPMQPIPSASVELPGAPPAQPAATGGAPAVPPPDAQPPAEVQPAAAPGAAPPAEPAAEPSSGEAAPDEAPSADPAAEPATP